MEAPSLLIAFVAGVLLFFLPCVLPLVPAYIGYLGGSMARSGSGSAAKPRPRAPMSGGERPRITSSASEGSPMPVTAASVGVATAVLERPVAAPRPAAAARPKQAAASRWI